MKYKLHPACEVWPPMSDEDVLKLAQDIEANGLLEPATITRDDLMLDGRNRAQACELVGVKLKTVVYEGDDEIGFVISKNLHRRHLSKKELAFIGAELAGLQNGTNQYQRKVGVASATPTITQAAKKVAKDLGLDRAMVMDAKAIRDKGSPNVIALAKSGEVGMRAAAAYARHTPKEEQEKASVETIKTKGNMPSGNTRKKPKTKRIDPPFRWASGLPTGDDLKGLDPNQRVHLHSFTVKQMLNAKEMASAMLTAILNVAGSTQPDGPAFFEAIDRMLAWKPEKGATNGKQIDFAKKAKSILDQLESALEIAIARLETYRAELEARGDPFNKKSCPIEHNTTTH